MNRVILVNFSCQALFMPTRHCLNYYGSCNRRNDVSVIRIFLNVLMTFDYLENWQKHVSFPFGSGGNSQEERRLCCFWSLPHQFEIRWIWFLVIYVVQGISGGGAKILSLPLRASRLSSKTVGTERGHQRADRLKLQSQTTSQSDHMALSNSVKLSHTVWGDPRWTGQGGEVWQNVVHWKREWQTTSVFMPWEPHEQYEKTKR